MFVLVILVSVLALAFGCGHKCGDPKLGPVLGGVDLVSLKDLFQAKAIVPSALPVLGQPQFNASVGEYSFWFQSSDNAKRFSSKPRSFIPQLGGYCAWGLTGLDVHVDDPSGYCLAGACLNSTKGFDFLYTNDEWEDFWFLKAEAKVDMEQRGGGVEANIAAAKKNFNAILTENSLSYCFNTDMLRTCP